MSRLLRFIGFGVSVVLAGCASVASDPDAYTQIGSEPEPARCELHGHSFSRVVYTPTRVQLPSSAAPIVLVCSAQGYMTATLNIGTEADGWILGNILLGEPIGIIVDGARGGGQKFSLNVSIVLEPKSFLPPAARDAWFDRQRQLIIEKPKRVLAGTRQSCEEGRDTPNSCVDELNRLRERRDMELKKLETGRSKAIIMNSGV